MFVLTKSGEAINTDFCAKFHILPDNPDRISVDAFHVSLFPEGFTKEQVLFGGTLEECRAYVAEWAQALNHDFYGALDVHVLSITMSMFGKIPLLPALDLNRLADEYRAQYDDLEPEELEQNLNEDLDMSNYWMSRGAKAAEKRAWGPWGAGNGPIRQLFRGGGLRPQRMPQMPQSGQAAPTTQPKPPAFTGMPQIGQKPPAAPMPQPSSAVPPAAAKANWSGLGDIEKSLPQQDQASQQTPQAPNNFGFNPVAPRDYNAPLDPANATAGNPGGNNRPVQSNYRSPQGQSQAELRGGVAAGANPAQNTERQEAQVSSFGQLPQDFQERYQERRAKGQTQMSPEQAVAYYQQHFGANPHGIVEARNRWAGQGWKSPDIETSLANQDAANAKNNPMFGGGSSTVAGNFGFNPEAPRDYNAPLDPNGNNRPVQSNYRTPQSGVAQGSGNPPSAPIPNAEPLSGFMNSRGTEIPNADPLEGFMNSISSTPLNAKTGGLAQNGADYLLRIINKTIVGQ